MANSDSAPRILPAHIEDTVRGIAALHAEHQRRATPMHRLVAKSVSLIGRPRSIAVLSLLLIAWVALNIAAGHRAFDAPPFPWLQDIGTALGVYITILILISQRRDDELGQLREQLTLELAILSEQKAAKVIELLEEMRRDNPLLADRVDHEAAAMAVPADPQAVLDALRDTNAEMSTAVSADPNGSTRSGESSEASGETL